MLRLILTILFIIVCVVLVVLVLLQEGKSNGLSAIGASADTYWSKNKGRSMEGQLANVTKVFAVLFILLAVLLNMNII